MEIEDFALSDVFNCDRLASVSPNIFPDLVIHYLSRARHTTGLDITKQLIFVQHSSSLGLRLDKGCVRCEEDLYVVQVIGS